MAFGAVLAALGVEFFLLPNGVIDSGVVGVSIILSEITDISKGLFTVLLNIPFLWFAYKHGGHKFIVRAFFSIIIFSLCLVAFERISAGLDKLIGIIFGALSLGLGVGIIMRFGGCLDGTEMFSLWLSKKKNVSVGTLLMIINIFIFMASAFVFGWNSALYSMVAYFFVTKLIDMVIEGVDESKAVMIITKEPEELAKRIMEDLGRSITYINGTKGYTRNEVQIIYSVVTRLEISKVREIISLTDPLAFMTITNLADVVGGHRHK
ncbi:MAG: YitT family protein [Oscillospiraceae bacterium]|nr:YitT family protein [Oscillospiraceae bacterium]